MVSAHDTRGARSEGDGVPARAPHREWPHRARMAAPNAALLVIALSFGLWLLVFEAVAVLFG